MELNERYISLKFNYIKTTTKKRNRRVFGVVMNLIIIHVIYQNANPMIQFVDMGHFVDQSAPLDF
jgi:hypothetical protein